MGKIYRGNGEARRESREEVTRLSIKALNELIDHALKNFDLHDEVHHVSFYQAGRLYDVKVEVEKVVTGPDGRKMRAYGLIFSIEGTEEVEGPSLPPRRP